MLQDQRISWHSVHCHYQDHRGCMNIIAAYQSQCMLKFCIHSCMVSTYNKYLQALMYSQVGSCNALPVATLFVINLMNVRDLQPTRIVRIHQWVWLTRLPSRWHRARALFLFCHMSFVLSDFNSCGYMIVHIHSSLCESNYCHQQAGSE